ncbi:MAG: UDP-N-acetylmuramate dehydrogenase [Alphaproteobacteria bacterium]|nr:UDP-N-acetylmuramate dehydrogenase [Alphaproteobacteria bacterium]
MSPTLPEVRGRLLRDEPLAPYTWFRVGGPADILFLPADPQDLTTFLARVQDDPALRSLPVTVIGVGSNLIVRDGGVRGIVIRLAGRAFAEIEVLEGHRIRAGAGALDSMVAKAAAKAGIAGLEFYVGVPGTIGGALCMNAGCYGRETKDVLVEATVFDRGGVQTMISPVGAFGYTYRRNAMPDTMVFLDATFQGEPGDVAEIEQKMALITSQREQSQPIRDKTGGSTFKNPPGENAWKLIDRAGFRGARRGGAQVSEKHCNFLINTGSATAADIEDLGEEVRAGVKAAFDVQLEWEIKRIGER